MCFHPVEDESRNILYPWRIPFGLWLFSVDVGNILCSLQGLGQTDRKGGGRGSWQSYYPEHEVRIVSGFCVWQCSSGSPCIPAMYISWRKTLYSKL